jgi:integrase/recombinase XerD
MTPLRQRMTEDMRTAGLASGTQALYLDAVRNLAAHYRRSPDELSEEEVRAYLLSLRERGVALGTFKTNHGGIQFLYRWTLDRDWPLFGKKRIRPPKQRRLPSALPDPEIRALLGCVRNPGHKTCLAVMYACGLRISEAASLEVGAIDSANMLLRVTGKGNKQRLVPLPRPLLDDPKACAGQVSLMTITNAHARPPTKTKAGRRRGGLPDPAVRGRRSRARVDRRPGVESAKVRITRPDNALGF